MKASTVFVLCQIGSANVRLEQQTERHLHLTKAPDGFVGDA